MDSKINLPQLAKALTLRKKMSQKDAEAFLREFFDAIIQNVTIDKIVKIKGLGTFKLIEVLDRESVNVNTGERFVIPGHTKLSFTPDTSLKDTVNKPFADFQTVVINEGTSLEEMERVPQEEEEITIHNSSQSAGGTQFTIQEDISSEEEMEENRVTKQKEEPEVEPEPEIVSESEIEPEPKTGTEDRKEEIPAPAALVQQSQSESGQKKPRRNIAKICAYIIGIILLCLLSFYAGNKIKYERGTKSEVQEDRQKEQESETADSLRATTTPLPQNEQSEETEYAQVPNGEYKITGTRKTYVMKPGDYLTRIAVEEYGDKEFTQYIITHNSFPDPDNVPVGSEIKLPELKKLE